MLGDCHTQFRHTQGTPLNFAQPFETVGANHHGADAPFFQFYCVVDTPRGAGASIRQTDNHRLNGLGQLLNDLFLGW